MKLIEAKKAIEEIVKIPFRELIDEEKLKDIKINKGKAGQNLELAIGLANSSRTLDFEDGELKTNKCDRNGKPKETVFITQINSIIDELLECKDFYESKLYKKISNMLYVRTCKDGKPLDWFYFQPIHVSVNEYKYGEIYKQIEKDYYSICRQLREHIETSEDGFIHTSNGKYIQIRSKDSQPYRPIYSEIYGRAVSNKNHAFYFKKEFVNEIIELYICKLHE